jgi:organic radical activating enzyme
VTYRVNEIFGPTLQGEGARTGTVNHWLRLAGCNLTCSAEIEGFDCDTDFSGGRRMTVEEVVDELLALPRAEWVVVSGGEPGMQLDGALINALHEARFNVAVETNGTFPLLSTVDWVSCSPKTAEHTLRVTHVDELRYVRAHGQALPKPRLSADHFYISPAFEPSGKLRRETLEWCTQLCMDNPRWALSIQLHKLIGVR